MKRAVFGKQSCGNWVFLQAVVPFLIFPTGLRAQGCSGTLKTSLNFCGSLLEKKKEKEEKRCELLQGLIKGTEWGALGKPAGFFSSGLLRGGSAQPVLSC